MQLLAGVFVRRLLQGPGPGRRAGPTGRDKRAGRQEHRFHLGHRNRESVGAGHGEVGRVHLRPGTGLHLRIGHHAVAGQRSHVVADRPRSQRTQRCPGHRRWSRHIVVHGQGADSPTTACGAISHSHPRRRARCERTLKQNCRRWHRPKRPEPPASPIRLGLRHPTPHRYRCCCCSPTSRPSQPGGAIAAIPIIDMDKFLHINTFRRSSFGQLKRLEVTAAASRLGGRAPSTPAGAAGVGVVVVAAAAPAEDFFLAPPFFACSSATGAAAAGAGAAAAAATLAFRSVTCWLQRRGLLLRRIELGLQRCPAPRSPI